MGLYDYPKIIKMPMDLGKVKRNLESGNYKTLGGCADDVRLIWKNCMTYNADGSNFFVLAQGLGKKWEDRFAKILKDHNVDSVSSTPLNSSSSNGSCAQSQKPKDEIAPPTLEEKRQFARMLYKLTKTEVGQVIVELDQHCGVCLTRNKEEDEVEIDIDKVSPKVFANVVQYVKSCIANNNQNTNKKQRTS